MRSLLSTGSHTHAPLARARAKSLAHALTHCALRTQGDAEMAEFAREEIGELSSKMEALEQKLKVLLLPK